MKLSTRGRYATRLLLCIASEQHAGPVRKQRIADSEGVSADYVEQILVALKNAGLVNSHRGVKGGFTLARMPVDMTIAEILRAVEGPVRLTPCLGQSTHCEREDSCVTREVWLTASQLLTDYFEGVTLQDLLERLETMRREAAPMYVI